MAYITDFILFHVTLYPVSTAFLLLIVESDLEKEIAILSFLLLLLSRMRLPRRSWNRIFWLVLKEGEVTAAAAAV